MCCEDSLAFRPNARKLDGVCLLARVVRKKRRKKAWSSDPLRRVISARKRMLTSRVKGETGVLTRPVARLVLRQSVRFPLQREPRLTTLPWRRPSNQNCCCFFTVKIRIRTAHSNFKKHSFCGYTRPRPHFSVDALTQRRKTVFNTFSCETRCPHRNDFNLVSWRRCWWQ